MNDKLWNPVRLGRITLPHRLAMAPMTRSRSTSSGVPDALNAEYYAQRASLGLLISEGTQPSEDGQGYLFTPGVHDQSQVDGWRLVADAVHAQGGHLFIQLMHTGRVSHPQNTSHGRQPVAPSAVQPAGKMFTTTGMQDIPEPRALSLAEVRNTVEDFRRAAALAIEAGADGVEIHGGNGYLIHQFLASNANQRTDPYGGSLENSTRFAVEVAAAVAQEIGADRTGFRISPGNPFNDIAERDTRELYEHLTHELAALDLVYLHIVQSSDEELLRSLREIWPNVLIVNRRGRPREEIGVDVADGLADIASVAAFALANPDLVTRLQSGAPLNEADPGSFYGGTELGYTDYPVFASVR
jgi:N-ethylmaleimide reductase